MKTTNNMNSRKLAIALPLAAGLVAAVIYRKPLLSAAGNLMNSTGLNKAIMPAMTAIGNKLGGATSSVGGMLSSIATKGPGAIITGGILSYALGKLRRTHA